MEQKHEMDVDYSKLIDRALKILDTHNIPFEQKLELFQELYKVMTDKFPIESKK